MSKCEGKRDRTCEGVQQVWQCHAATLMRRMHARDAGTPVRMQASARAFHSRSHSDFIRGHTAISSQLHIPHLIGDSGGAPRDSGEHAGDATVEFLDVPLVDASWNLSFCTTRV